MISKPQCPIERIIVITTDVLILRNAYEIINVMYVMPLLGDWLTDQGLQFLDFVWELNVQNPRKYPYVCIVDFKSSNILFKLFVDVNVTFYSYVFLPKVINAIDDIYMYVLCFHMSFEFASLNAWIYEH